jgi:hypothetical protein
MKRTFLDYIEDYSYDGFDSFARAFLKWQEVHGYMETIFTNSMYIWYNDTFEVLIHGENQCLEEPQLWSEKKEKWLEIIHGFGYQTEFFRDTYFEQGMPPSIDTPFVESFLEILFSELKPERKLQRSDDENTIYKAFEQVDMVNHDLHEQKVYTDLLRQFIQFYQKYTRHLGIYLVRDITHYWKDIGLVIYDKWQLSRSILFYQIGDSN